MKIAKFVLPVLAAGFAASTAMAATSEVVQNPANLVAGTTANSLLASGEGADWTGVVLSVKLTSGSVHNGAPDSNGPQAAFWAVPGFQALEFDTWVGVPFDGTNGIAGGAGDIPGAGPLSMAGQTISVTGFNTTTTDTAANLRVGNITLSNDAVGTWQMIMSFAGGVLVQSSGVVEGGAMVPEPASLALLGLGGIAALRRR